MAAELKIQFLWQRNTSGNNDIIIIKTDSALCIFVQEIQRHIGGDVVHEASCRRKNYVLRTKKCVKMPLAVLILGIVPHVKIAVVSVFDDV